MVRSQMGMDEMVFEPDTTEPTTVDKELAEQAMEGWWLGNQAVRGSMGIHSTHGVGIQIHSVISSREK